MPWLSWLPWRFLLRRVAQAHGFLDPIALLAQIEGFAQPSEVQQPIELLRAGVVFHARGLINSRVVQHNLDWVWPYWIERQFDPEDPAFLPRAFSATHVNLTHRNWTAIGRPDCDALPIVDPRGLLTPRFDGWSLEGWVIGDDGERLLPSKAKDCRQVLAMEDGLEVVTAIERGALCLTGAAAVDAGPTPPCCRWSLEAASAGGGWLVLALRPYNPEGVSFIHRLALAATRDAWIVDQRDSICFDQPADRHHLADYRAGDVGIHLHDREEAIEGSCAVGMLTAAAMFRLQPGTPRRITVRIPLELEFPPPGPAPGWSAALRGCCRLEIPDPKVRFLFDAALRTLVLHAPHDVYPGPFTYKRFWFRDAAFIINAMLAVGLHDRAARAIGRFFGRQRSDGYFHSQDGEWDANGAVLWVIDRFAELTGRTIPPAWRQPIVDGARWIVAKRHDDGLEAAHAGLLPAGFSAEHLGPNDYYYWDDFLGIAGLRAAARLAARWGDDAVAESFESEAAAFTAAVERSLLRSAQQLGRPAIAASPYRRLDSGAIGSLVAGYPLQLRPPDDPLLLGTVGFLMENCLVRGGFFQDMIHSGINPYLTLHIAQLLLRHGDPRYLALMDIVADAVSPTGQWPEAIHPRTGGGCMGDGQHAWAAAEWLMMVRHCFVREEGLRLILCQGIPERWLGAGEEVAFGPAATAFGSLSIRLTRRPESDAVLVSWTADWRDGEPPIELRLPGHQPAEPAPGAGSILLSRAAA